MARKLDEAPFKPVVPDDERPYATVRKLTESLLRIYGELLFQLSSLGAENFDRGGLVSLGSALDVPKLWSSFTLGEVVPAGTIVIYAGTLWRAKRDVVADGASITEGSDFERAG